MADPIEMRPRDVLTFKLPAESWGSNMARATVRWGDDITPVRLWKYREVPYQLAKFNDLAIRRRMLEAYARLEQREPGAGPYAVKKIASEKALEPHARPDWNQGFKITHMRALLHDAFERDRALAAVLVGTGDGYLQEGNTWADVFWGVALVANARRGVRAGEGLNTLGRLLMEERNIQRVAFGLEPIPVPTALVYPHDGAEWQAAIDAAFGRYKARG